MRLPEGLGDLCNRDANYLLGRMITNIEYYEDWLSVGMLVFVRCGNIHNLVVVGPNGHWYGVPAECIQILGDDLRVLTPVERIVYGIDS